jgi:hypothetical protein
LLFRASDLRAVSSGFSGYSRTSDLLLRHLCRRMLLELS